MQQAWNVEKWRRLSVDVCGNFLLRTSLSTGMWVLQAERPHVPHHAMEPLVAVWGRVGTPSIGREFLGRDLPGTLNKVFPSFKMRTELVIAFLQVLNVQL